MCSIIVAIIYSNSDSAMKVMSLDLYKLTFLCSAAVIFMYTKHIICKNVCSIHVQILTVYLILLWCLISPIWPQVMQCFLGFLCHLLSTEITPFFFILLLYLLLQHKQYKYLISEYKIYLYGLQVINAQQASLDFFFYLLLSLIQINFIAWGKVYIHV